MTLRLPSARTRLVFLGALAVAWALSSAVSVADPAREQVRIGVLAKRGSERCLQKWGPTAEYLTSQIPGRSFSIIPLGFDEIHQAVDERQVEFVLANSSFYVDLEVRSGVRRLATLNNLHADGMTHTAFAGVIFCRADRQDIQTFQDLKNKVFMAVDERSLGGWHMALRELKEHGIDPGRDMADLRFGGRHDAVVYAVLAGEVDAGTVRSDTLERMAAEGKINLADFRVINQHEDGEVRFLHSTEHYPEWPFAQSPHTTDELAKQIAVALMRMPADSPAARTARCAGWSIPQNYQPVHECLIALRLPPYQDYGKVTIGDAIRQYWLWLLGISLLMTLIALIVVRVSRLKARLEQSLLERAERERLTCAIEQVADTIVITDVEGVIQYVNPAFERISGYSCDEAIGRNPSLLKSGEHDRAFFEEMWETLTRGETWTGRLINRKRDGTLYTEEARISPVRDAEGLTVNYVAVKHDITDEITLEEQFRQAQKMESVGRLAGGVAHDFNNMLGVILGYTELVMEEVDPSLPHYANLEEIRSAAERSVDVTRQLLAFARKQTVAPLVLDLNETVGGLLKMMHRLIGEDIDLAWRPGARGWLVKMDPSQTDQILANLCINARDAIDGVGKVTIETGNVIFDETYCAEHSGFLLGEYVMLGVSDDGCGMDKETLDKIYEPFFTTKGMGRGTGLGLATVYGIVKQNNGFINVYSEPGQGTSFKIYLPRHTTGIKQKQKIMPDEPAKRGNETILLVEDEPAFLGMITVMLDRQGYTVLATSSPSDALRLAREANCRIHLLMTDVVMPEMNGRDLAENLLTVCPTLKCLFMSGYTANVIAHHGVLDEGVHFIQKPFVMRNLAAKVREVLETE